MKKKLFLALVFGVCILPLMSLKSPVSADVPLVSTQLNFLFGYISDKADEAYSVIHGTGSTFTETYDCSNSNYYAATRYTHIANDFLSGNLTVYNSNDISFNSYNDR